MKFNDKYNKIMEAFKGPSTEHILDRPEIKKAFKVIEAYKDLKFDEFTYQIIDRRQLTYDERQDYRHKLIKLLEDKIQFNDKKFLKYQHAYALSLVPRGSLATNVNDESSLFEFSVDDQLKFKLKLVLSTTPAQHTIIRIADLGPFDEVTSFKFNAAIQIITSGHFTLYPANSIGSGIQIDPFNSK